VPTFDLDFGDILAVARTGAPSVIIFRLRNQTPSAVNPRLFRVISDCESELTGGAIIIVEDQGYRQSHPELSSDAAALEQAIREGVTRDKSVGQGNGLFGSYQVCSHSMGSFQLESGHGKLAFTERGGLRVSSEKVPFDGTLVVAQINFSDPRFLEEALRFGGRPHVIVDFVELNYEQHDRDESSMS
jgi:hypothetical protein